MIEQSMQLQEARAVLEWYLAAGVTETIEPEPQNQFMVLAPPARQAVAPSPTAQRTVSPALTAAPSAAIAKARELADAASTLAELREAVMQFDGCALKKTAARAVFADGNPDSGVMLVGEAPEDDDDRQGIPFSGASGKLLNKMFESIGLPREKLYITNSIFWRPPGKRDASPEEIAICRPFVEKHIALVQPRVLVLLGVTPLKTLLPANANLNQARGKSYSYSNAYLPAPITAFVTFTPKFLLLQSAQKRLSWHDLLAIEAFLR